jgi:pyruvate-formate lyase-activating enzyme
VERAKPEAVEKARADHAHHTAEAERLSAALKRLGQDRPRGTGPCHHHPRRGGTFRLAAGEGASLGRPSVFVRLSRCNLACRWCDTAYTWRFSGDNRPHRDDIAFERTANQVTADEDDIARADPGFRRSPPGRDGGEPLLQAPALPA